MYNRGKTVTFAFKSLNFIVLQPHWVLRIFLGDSGPCSLILSCTTLLSQERVYIQNKDKKNIDSLTLRKVCNNPFHPGYIVFTVQHKAENMAKFDCRLF